MEIWFQDEARLGQKNGLTRLWARKGTRPRQPADQRYHNAYLFGAICPAHGKGAALMLYAQDPLDEISRHVARKALRLCLIGPDGTPPANFPKNLTINSGTEPIWLLARQLALQPRVRRLQCQCWMRSLEQAHRTARNHHINRNAKMGPYGNVKCRSYNSRDQSFFRAGHTAPFPHPNAEGHEPLQ